jgi:hypothetical protein
MMETDDFEKDDLYDAMEGLGWTFMPVAPEEWTWLKFKDGKHVGSHHDAEWYRDVNNILASK